MPYYHAFVEGPFSVVGEETTIGAVYDRRISTIEKLGFGPRAWWLIGERPLQIKANTHDEAIVTATKDNVLIVIQHHDIGSELQAINDRQPISLQLTLEPKDPKKITKVLLRKGQTLPLFRSSLCLDGRPDEQLRWSRSQESCGEDFFDSLASAAIHEALNS